jgi:hypothetical protein
VRIAASCVLAIAFFSARVAWPHAATSNTVLFDREIVAILNDHCVMCHAERALAFPLSTYEQTWLARAAVHREVLAHRMPPWPAVQGFGKFANANALTLRETRFIVSWVEGLGPRNAGEVFLNVQGSAARAEIEARSDYRAWRLGAPDTTVELPGTASGEPVATGARLRVQRVAIDLRLDSERRLRALEYRPADRSALHAVVFTVEQTGQWLSTWTPWYGYRELPEGAAFRLPAGARIVAEIHTATESPSNDGLGELGLHFAQPSARRESTDVVLEASAVAGADAQRRRLHAEVEVATELQALALWPQLPAGAESLEVAVRRPDGRIEVWLYALHIPLEWPTAFVLAKPAELPAGSRLSVTAYATSTLDPAEQRLRLTVSTVSAAANDANLR